jgi:hypothetical protein
MLLTDQEHVAVSSLSRCSFYWARGCDKFAGGGLGQVFLAFSGAGSLVSLKLPLSILPSLFALFHAGFSLFPPFLAAAFTGLEGVTSTSIDNINRSIKRGTCQSL